MALVPEEAVAGVVRKEVLTKPIAYLNLFLFSDSSQRDSRGFMRAIPVDIKQLGFFSMSRKPHPVPP